MPVGVARRALLVSPVDLRRPRSAADVTRRDTEVTSMRVGHATARTRWPTTLETTKVGDEVVSSIDLSRLALSRGAEDRHHRDQGEADHQGARRWPRCAAGCAARSASASMPTVPNSAPVDQRRSARDERPAERPGWRAATPSRATRMRRPRPSQPGFGRRRTGPRHHRRRAPTITQPGADQQPHSQRRLRQRDVVAQGGDRRHPRRAAGGQVGRDRW